jgi:hypothetical protein
LALHHLLPFVYNALLAADAVSLQTRQRDLSEDSDKHKFSKYISGVVKQNIKPVERLSEHWTYCQALEKKNKSIKDMRITRQLQQKLAHRTACVGCVGTSNMIGQTSWYCKASLLKHNIIYNQFNFSWNAHSAAKCILKTQSFRLFVRIQGKRHNSATNSY